MADKQPGLVALAVGALALLLAPACGSGSGAGGPGGSSGSAAPATVRSALPSPSEPVTEQCAGALRQLTIEAGKPPRPVCLRVGATLVITTPSAPLQPWQQFTSSNPQVLACDTRKSADGAATATCRARQPGRATVRTMTAAFSGDPHGPAQQLWLLPVTVQPA